MSVFESIRTHAERLLTTPTEELGRWAHFVQFQIRLWRVCLNRLWEHNMTAMSAALSFRTIFAMIPLLVLGLLAVKSLGVLEDGKQALRSVLEQSGISQIAVVEESVSQDSDSAAIAQVADSHDDGEARNGATDVAASNHAENLASDQMQAEPDEVIVYNVADEIEAIVANVESQLTFSRIGPVGVLLLVWTALTLLTTIERSLNRIFDASEHRSLWRRLPLYWTAVTLGPLILVGAQYLGHKIVELFEGLTGIAWLFRMFGRLEPAVVGILFVAGMYKFFPNTHIRYRAAIGGALVAVPLWLVAKWGFRLYITELVVGGNLYGALGLLPLFLLWLNLSWTIFLFGAELAHAAAILPPASHDHPGQTEPSPPR